MAAITTSQLNPERLQFYMALALRDRHVETCNGNRKILTQCESVNLLRKNTQIKARVGPVARTENAKNSHKI